MINNYSTFSQKNHLLSYFDLICLIYQIYKESVFTKNGESMTLKILVIGDPIDELKPEKETTLALIAEATARNHRVDYCTATELCQKTTGVFGNVRQMKLTGNVDDYFDLGDEYIQDLSTYSLIIMRSNPNGYKRMNTSYLLDPLADKVLIVNDPRGMREMHGKFFITNFPEYITPFSIVEHHTHFKDFLNEHDDVIIKPVNGFGGDGIFRLNEKPADPKAKFDEIYQSFGQEPFIMQRYLPEAEKGDKRIIMFDGEPVCSLLRVPKDTNSLANISQGANIEKCDLTEHEKKLCAKIAPILQDYGLFFVGIDMLGDYITEINLISVGTVVPANNLYGIQLEKLFWNKLEEKYRDFKNNVA